jgi:hypothetical protein
MQLRFVRSVLKSRQLAPLVMAAAVCGASTFPDRAAGVASVHGGGPVRSCGLGLGITTWYSFMILSSCSRPQGSD